MKLLYIFIFYYNVVICIKRCVYIPMGSSFPEKRNYFKLELVQNAESQTLKDINDIYLAIKSSRRGIKERIEFLENQPQNTDADREIAVLIRQDQYLEALQNKQKYELEEIFFPNGKDNCIVPEIFQWYQGPEAG